MRAQVFAKRLVLCDGLCLAGGHEDTRKLSDWRNWSASDMRGWDAGGQFKIPHRTRANPDGPSVTRTPRSSAATGSGRTCVGGACTALRSRAGTGGARARVGSARTTTARRSTTATGGARAHVVAARTTTVRPPPSATGGARTRGGARIGGAALLVRPIRLRRSGGPCPDRLAATPPVHRRA